MNLSESKIHFVGIGGIGMSGIAEVLVNMGCTVTGSDQGVNSQVERLSALGVKIEKGHGAEHVPYSCDAVVYSSAVSLQNPELKEARRRKIPIIQRAEMLAELMALKRGIAVGGTHGKTTTTSMIATLLLSAQLDPTVVIGGRLDLIKSTAALGKGEWIVAEADESDGSFLRLSPEIAVVTNIDNDHMDHYKNWTTLEKAFEDFCRRIPFYGVAILCGDDARVLKLASRFGKRMVTYGIKSKAQLRATRIQVTEEGQQFVVEFEGDKLGEIILKVAGQHNVLNALATIAVGLELKLPWTTIVEGMSSYKGVDRRMQQKGTYNNVPIIDDYGHHPTEIEVTLKGLRQTYPRQRLLVAFQPHRYTRTQACWDQFLKCFKEADVVGILDVYSAGEPKIKGVDSKKLVRAISKKQKQVLYWGKQTEALKFLRQNLKSGDVFVMLGAGDIWKIGIELLKPI